MRPNWWQSSVDPDPRCFCGPESNEVWTLPEWQYLRRKSIYPSGVRLPKVTIVEPQELWTMDMIYAQLEEDLFAGPMIVDPDIQRRRWRRALRRGWRWPLHPPFGHLRPYTFPHYGQGVYAIYDEEQELVYIGMSGCVIDRAPAHCLSTSTYRAVRMKPFRRDEVRYFESRLLRKYNPIWN